MKLRIIVIFLLLLAPTTGRALSADDSPLQAELRGAGEAASPALVYFGGTSPELRVRLSGVFHGDLAVKATLQQQSAPLSAAFPESVPVLDEQTLRVEGSLSVPFTMAFPPVRAESHFKLRLWGRSGHTGDWHDADGHAYVFEGMKNEHAEKADGDSSRSWIASCLMRDQ